MNVVVGEDVVESLLSGDDCGWRLFGQCLVGVTSEDAVELRVENARDLSLVGGQFSIFVVHAAYCVSADTLPLDVGVHAFWVVLGVGSKSGLVRRA